MDQCGVIRDRMPELLTEALGSRERESTHQHIEQCAACAAEWAATREVWTQLGDITERPLPARLRQEFIAEAQQILPQTGKVVRLAAPPARRWLAQAAAAAILIAGAFFAGRMAVDPGLFETPATVQKIEPAFSLTDRAVIPASQVNPEIQGNPQIQNVRFQQDGTNDGVSISFDLTSHVTITGSPEDKSLVSLLSYVLQNRDYPTYSRSNAIQFVGETYADTSRIDSSSELKVDPEIVKALVNVLENDTHEGVRIKAVEALRSLPSAVAGESRAALVKALKNDPNPAVRMKSVEALAEIAAGDASSLDLSAIDALREKAGQEDENLYVRVKAAEALSQIRL